MIICLESEQDAADSQRLSELIQEAIESKDQNLIRRIRRCWREDAFGRRKKRGERWAEIKRKIAVENSTWYVWWMDGVRAFGRNARRQKR